MVKKGLFDWKYTWYLYYLKKYLFKFYRLPSFFVARFFLELVFSLIVMYSYIIEEMARSRRKMLLRIMLSTGTSKISINRYGIESKIKTVILTVKKILLAIINFERYCSKIALY